MATVGASLALLDQTRTTVKGSGNRILLPKTGSAHGKSRQNADATLTCSEGIAGTTRKEEFAQLGEEVGGPARESAMQKDLEYQLQHD